MFLLLLTCFTSIIKLVFSQEEELVNCEPIGVRISLSDYYLPLSDSLNYYRIFFESNCSSIDSFSTKVDNIALKTSNLTRSVYEISEFNSETGAMDVNQTYIYTFEIQKFNNSFLFPEIPFNYTINYKPTSQSKELTAFRTFKTHLLHKDFDEGVKFNQTVVFLGMWDINYGKVTLEILKNEVENNRIDLMVFLGDMAYNLTSDKGEKGKTFRREIEPITSKIPFMATPGVNEESDQFVYYNYFFQSYDSSQIGVYFFEIAKAHFIQIDMRLYLSKEKVRSNLLNVLENDLKNAYSRINRPKRPWIIAYGYVPFYCSDLLDNACKYTIDTELYKNIEDIFDKYKVDFYLSSGINVYEAFHPILNNVEYPVEKESKDLRDFYINNPKHILYIIEGVAGNGKIRASYEKKSWTIANHLQNGFGLMTFIDEKKIFYVHNASINKYMDERLYTNTLERWSELWPLKEKIELIVSSFIFALFGLAFLIMFAKHVDNNF